MRVLYVPESPKAWNDYYKHQSVQSGYGLQGYHSASPFQRGAGIGSLLGGIFRSFLPVIKSAGKTIGKQALKTGAEIAADSLSGKDIGEAVEQRAKAGAAKLLSKAVNKLDAPKRPRKQQKGRGLGTRQGVNKETIPIKRKRKAKGTSGGKRQRRDQLGVFLA